MFVIPVVHPRGALPRREFHPGQKLALSKGFRGLVVPFAAAEG
jgi:hypothetical protein